MLLTNFKILNYKLMKKLLTSLKTHLLKYFKVGNKFTEDTPRLKYMKKKHGSIKEQWERVKYVIMYPTVLISLIIGFGSLPFVILSNNEIVDMIFTATSTIGLGVGVNYFTFYLKEETEFKILKYYGEHTVKILNSKIEKILQNQTLTQDNKNDIYDFLQLVDYWKDYVDYADTSKISYHNRLKLEIEQEVDPNKKKLLETTKLNLENNWEKNGVGSFFSLSSNTIYNEFKFK